MAGVLQHLRSSTLNKRPNPASMVDGQLAINYASGSPGAFFKDTNGNLVKVGPVHVGTTAPNVSPASGGTAGNSLGEQWLDTSGGTYVFKIWDGAAWRSEAGEFVNSTGDTMTGSLTMGPSVNLIFEGSTDDGFETTLTVVDPTADRTITLPNVSGTVVTTGDSGTVTSTMITDGTIVNADVNASAAIAGTKISPDFGSQTIQTTGVFSHAVGSAGAPIITFTGDTNTGIYSPGADQVAISTGGSGRLFVDANGNIGVGTASPQDKVSISGGGFSFSDTGGAARNISWKNLADNIAPVVIRGDAPNGALIFSTNTLGNTGTERLRIDSSGRLLVGTSSANQYNHYSNAIRYQQVGTDATSASAQYTIFENSANGPGLLLGKSRSGTQGTNTIVQNSDSLGAFIFLGADGTNWVRAAQIEAQVDGTPGTNDMPGRLVFSVTPDGGSSPTTLPSAMTINSGQEVLIGYSADNGAYKLQVNSQIFATSATIATSDGRYKENVATLGGCLDLIKALRPVSFTWKPQQAITRINDEGEEVVVREPHNFPEGTQVGFIAQEVQEVLEDKPWLGSVIKENVRPAVKDNEGNELAPEEQFFGIAEGNLIAVLTNALQEAVGRIEALEAEVAALKG